MSERALPPLRPAADRAADKRARAASRRRLAAELLGEEASGSARNFNERTAARYEQEAERLEREAAELEAGS
jgi:hypothetical protein